MRRKASRHWRDPPNARPRMAGPDVRRRDACLRGTTPSACAVTDVTARCLSRRATAHGAIARKRAPTKATPSTPCPHAQSPCRSALARDGVMANRIAISPRALRHRTCTPPPPPCHRRPARTHRPHVGARSRAMASWQIEPQCPHAHDAIAREHAPTKATGLAPTPEGMRHRAIAGSRSATLPAP